MKISAMVAAAALSLVSAVASAGPIDLSTGSTGFSATPIIGTFVDTYTFSLVLSVFASGSVTSVVGGAQDIDFTSIVVTGPSGSFAFTQLLPDPFETWGLASTVLGPGSYTITLTGLNSAAGASYGGNFAVSAVPEPDALALMFAGLGAIGFVARRRSRT